MSQYFDNQKNWEWHVTEEKAEVVTDHGTHTHTLDLSKVSVGEISENTGKVLGDAHRAAPHDFKQEEETTKMANDRSSFLDRIRCDQETIDKVNEVSKNSQSPAMRSNENNQEGGRERGEDGPGSRGREADLKGENTSQVEEASSQQTDVEDQNGTGSPDNSQEEGTEGQNGGQEGPDNGQEGGQDGQDNE